MTRRVCLTLFLLTSQMAAADVTLNSSYDASVRPALTAVARDVWSIVHDLFASKPPIDLPIVCYVVPAARVPNSPITQLNDWVNPTEIDIGLTVSNLGFDQFVFQLAHELGHVMLNPRRTNSVIETVCSALAYDVLDRMADKWAMVTPTGIQRGYEENFKKYRARDERERLARLPESIRLAVEHHNWILVSRYLQKRASKELGLEQSTLADQNGRDLEALGALALLSKSVEWKRLLDLGGCTAPAPRVYPQFAVLPLNQLCNKRLPDVLCRMGGCSTLTR